jgi:plastocyanin domain-containing protein
MPLDKLLVTIGGVAAVGWVYWYFFVAARRRLAVAPAIAGVQEITIAVDGGYAPSLVSVEARRPVRLHFDRRDRGSCTDEVVLADFGVRRFLPTGQTTTIEFTPQTPGRFDFACGMGMVHGTLQVRA